MRRALLLIFLAALGATAWWILTDGDGKSSELERSNSDTTEAGFASMGIGTSAPAALEQPDASGETTSRSVVEPEPAGGRILTVRVVKEIGGTGIAGVGVRLVDWKAPENAAFVALARNTYRDREADVQSVGVLVVSDATGHARFARPESASLYARQADSYAESSVSWQTPDAMELVLEHDLEVRALVLDADSQPVAGVPVAWMTWNGDSASIQMQARSGEDGIARIRHLQTRARGAPTIRSVLLASLPGGTDGQVGFDPTLPPLEPILLRLPTCGSVEVTVLDADGEKFPDGTPVILQGALDEHEKARYFSYTPSLHDEKGRVTAWTQDGIAQFEHVGIGQRLEVLAYHPDLREYFGIEAEALTVAGEHRRILLQLAEAPTVLTARLLRPDGSPITNDSAASRLCFDGGSAGRTLSTDADGRFRHFLNDDKYPPGARRVWWIAHADEQSPGIHVALVPLPLLLGPGTHDLGEISMGAGGVLAEGQVVDADGIPLVGVALGLRPAGASGSEYVDLPRGRSRTRHLTGPDGSFLFLGADAATDWSLQFTREGYRRVELKLPAGSSDLRVTLESDRPRILGKLLLDTEIPHELLSLRWEPQVRSANRPSLNFASDGTLSCDSTASGAGSLQVIAKSSDEVLCTISELSLDGKLPLPPLDPLDLRDRLFFHQVQVDGPGTQIPGSMRVDFGTPRRMISSHWGNPIRFLTPEREREITIYAPGAAAKSLHLSGGLAELRVEAGRPVRWELLGEEWRASGAKITVTPAVRNGGALEGFHCELDAAGRGDGVLPGPGTYLLYLEYAFEIEGKTHRSSSYADALTPEGEQEFEIAAGDAPVLIQFRLKEGALERARKSVED